MTDVLEGGPLGRREPELDGKRENKDALVLEGATLAIPKVEKARTVGAFSIVRPQTFSADILPTERR